MKIIKHHNFVDNVCLTGLDKKRDKAFNENKEIEVTEEEFKNLSYRWVVIKEKSNERISKNSS